MQISFRQGIIVAPATPFLSFSSTNHVDLVIPSNTLISLTFADGNGNYLYTEKDSITNAWVGTTTITSNTVTPFQQNVPAWLFWDISETSGLRSFGATIHQPLFSATPPPSPALDQHWFNTALNTMNVWNGNGWIKKIRVFAARLTNNSIFTSVSNQSPVFTGTQVGILSVNEAGYLVYDEATGHPIKKPDGTFFSTVDTVLTGITSTAQVKFGSILVEGIATTPIPAYSVVRFTSFGMVGTASGFSVDNGAYGIIETNATTGDTVSIAMEGLITNPAWNWTSAGVNAPLFVDNNGQLTATPTATPIVVASVVDIQTVLIRPSSLAVNTLNDPASPTNMGSTFLSVVPADVNVPIAVGINDPGFLSLNAHLNDTISHLTLAQHNLILGLTTPGAQITLNANSYSSNVLTLVDNSGITWDMSKGTFAIITLAASTVLHAPTNIPTGTLITLTILQDSFGLHGLTFPAVFKWAGSLPPSIALNASNARTILTFISDGTFLFEVSRAVNVI